MGRAPCCDKANVKKGPWSPEEDAKLKDYIEKYGTGGNWIALPQKIGLKRCGKSCRLRWLNYLRPNIKHGGFSEEEDNLICSLYISIGSRWSIIAAQLPGRTDNDIKNYWNTKLKKKLLGKRKHASSINRSQDANNPKDGGDNDNNQSSQGLSNSALERLQLHMQLQSLQNPFSFYNNPALWPKLHPLQEKLIRNCIQKENPENGNYDHHLLMKTDDPLPSPDDNLEKKREPDASGDHPLQHQLYQNQSPTSLLQKMNYDHGTSYYQPLLDGSSVAFASGTGNDHMMMNCGVMQKYSSDDGTDRSNMTTQPASSSSFQAELESFLMNNNQMAADQFDCLKEMNNSKDKWMLWSNEFDTKSASSNSWDSVPAVDQQQSEEGLMFSDYDQLGIN